MLKFYICKTCGNLILKVEDGGNTPVCCGKQMSALIPASTDGAIEKHVPVIDCSDITPEKKTIHIHVGSTPHPSETYHYIKWIALETNKGIHLHYLNIGDDPCASFILCEEEDILHAYAYCNLHGLWMS